MAKRSAPDEQPYRPLLDAGLMSAVLGPVSPDPVPIATVAEVGKVVEMSRPEPLRRAEPTRPDLEVLSGANEMDRRAQAAQVLVEKFDQEKRILFTRGETQAIDRLV